MKGIYTLLIELKKDSKIEVGALREIDFKKGYYVYVGSAQNGIEARVKRHLRDEKRKHWHIDYLLDNSDIDRVFVLDGNKEEECKVAKYLASSLEKIDDFGSSDCNCTSHLFYTKDFDKLVDLLYQYDELEKYKIE